MCRWCITMFTHLGVAVLIIIKLTKDFSLVANLRWPLFIPLRLLYFRSSLRLPQKVDKLTQNCNDDIAYIKYCYTCSLLLPLCNSYTNQIISQPSTRCDSLLFSASWNKLSKEKKESVPSAKVTCNELHIWRKWSNILHLKMSLLYFSSSNVNFTQEVVTILTDEDTNEQLSLTKKSQLSHRFSSSTWGPLTRWALLFYFYQHLNTPIFLLVLNCIAFSSPPSEWIQLHHITLHPFNAHLHNLSLHPRGELNWAVRCRD